MHMGNTTCCQLLHSLLAGSGPSVHPLHQPRCRAAHPKPIALHASSLQARVNVPDDRFKWLCETYEPKSQVPAFLDIVDIAGLVK